MILGSSEVRALFPAAARYLYLDAAYQSPLATPIRAQLDRFYDVASEDAGPKAVWLRQVETVRSRLASYLGVESDHLAFTKNTSEGLSICANGIGWDAGDNVVLPEGEHPNNVYPWLVQRSAGLNVRFAPADKGWVDAETVRPFVDKRTRAICLSHVMFHSGQRNDVEGIVRLASEFGIAVVVDAMQSVGVLSLDLKKLGATAVASGSHKGLLVPHGLGFLYTAQDNEQLATTYVAAAGVANLPADLVVSNGVVRLRAGAGRFEIGNYNLSAIHALGAALDLLEGLGQVEVEDHLLSLGDRLIETADRLGIAVVGPRQRSHRSHIYVLGLRGQRWREFFEEHRTRVSWVRDGVRISFGIYNNGDDVLRLGELLELGLRTNRDVSS